VQAEETDGPRVSCRACGQEVIPGRFCSRCGLSLPLRGRSKDRCTSCGSLLARDALYCTDCGSPTGARLQDP